MIVLSYQGVLMSEKTLLSMSEAAEMVGLTRPTFYRKVEELGISIAEDNGKKRVDVSELIRVFGTDVKIHKERKEEVSKTSNNASTDKKSRTEEDEDIRVKLAVLESELERERKLREEIKDEVEYFKEQVALEKEEKKKITLLIEDLRPKEGRGEAWEKSIRALEQRIANQEKAAKEREEREQKLLDENRRIKQAYSKQKKALEEEKSKSFFQKLFG